MKLGDVPASLKAINFNPLLRVMATMGTRQEKWVERWKLEINGKEFFFRKNAFWYDLYTDQWRIKLYKLHHYDPVAFGGDPQRCESDLMLLKMFQ